jgi:hypothetical protein
MLVGVLAGTPFEELFARSVAFSPENGSVWRMDVLEAGERVRVSDVSAV